MQTVHRCSVQGGYILGLVVAFERDVARMIAVCGPGCRRVCIQKGFLLALYLDRELIR